MISPFANNFNKWQLIVKPKKNGGNPLPPERVSIYFEPGGMDSIIWQIMEQPGFAHGNTPRGIFVNQV